VFAVVALVVMVMSVSNAVTKTVPAGEKWTGATAVLTIPERLLATADELIQ